MEQSFFVESEFLDFIEHPQNRKEFIQKMLNNNGLDAPVLQMDGKNHIYVNFPKAQYSKNKSIKTIIAHYDIFSGSPGANDNSFAVYCILKWAILLHKNYQNTQAQHNVRVIFTDGEECGEEGVKSQGAFALAKVFKRLKILNDDIFVFDCMGRGEVPCICDCAIFFQANSLFVKKYRALEQKACNAISKITNGNCFKIKSNYSDNASFLANGIPAVCITMLPFDELQKYMSFNEIPYTWKILHTKDDNYLNITEKSIQLMALLLDELYKM